MQLLLLSREPFAPLHRPQNCQGASQIRFQQLAGRVTPAAEQNAPASSLQAASPLQYPKGVGQLGHYSFVTLALGFCAGLPAGPDTLSAVPRCHATTGARRQSPVATPDLSGMASSGDVPVDLVRFHRATPSGRSHDIAQVTP